LTNDKKAASPPHIDAFNGIRQVARVCTPPDTCFLGRAHPSLQPKRHLDRFSRLQGSLYCDRQTDRQTDRPTHRPTDHATRTV